MKTMTRNILTSLLLTCLAASTLAAPVPEDERIPLDLRRTTLVVRDIDRSLALYRDALGMKVSYDSHIRTPRDAASDEAAERALRLAFMQANDDFVGVLGLLQYIKPAKEQPVSDLAFEPGTIVLVFNVKDLDQRWEAVVNTPGVEVLNEPEKTSYPSYDGKGTIPVMVSVIRDPDGFIIELNQLLVEELH
jgi:catechol 2,3-dioxygenase-like lactoylglutathione lyase family enzyme